MIDAPQSRSGRRPSRSSSRIATRVIPTLTIPTPTDAMIAADDESTPVNCTIVGAFAVSLGPIFWLLNAEIYPLEVRSKAAAAGTMANWFFNFVVSLTFLSLIDALGRGGAFLFYAAMCAITVVFCARLVPETKGKHLEDITAYFQDRVDARRAAA